MDEKKPNNRVEDFLSELAGEGDGVTPEPLTREEKYLSKILENELQNGEAVGALSEKVTGLEGDIAAVQESLGSLKEEIGDSLQADIQEAKDSAARAMEAAESSVGDAVLERVTWYADQAREAADSATASQSAAEGASEAAEAARDAAIANGKVDGKPGVTPELKKENGFLQVSYNSGVLFEDLLNMAQFKGERGQDGSPGAPGAAGLPGADGASPQLRKHEGAIEMSYDEGQTWVELVPAAEIKGDKGNTGPRGKDAARGENGPKGETGETGDDGRTITGFTLELIGNEDGTVTGVKTCQVQYSDGVTNDIPCTIETGHKVEFYNYDAEGAEVLLETAYVVNGANAVYQGETPKKAEGTADLTHDADFYAFTGWKPDCKNVTGDLKCYAQFVDSYDEESITDTWDEIFAAIDDGTYKDKYKLGDTKRLKFGREGWLAMQIVAFDTDEKEDGTKAPITWISRQCLPVQRRMNPAWDSTIVDGTGSVGGWWKSELYPFVTEYLLGEIEENVRARILPVKKYTAVDQESKTDTERNMNKETVERLWLPSWREMNFDAGRETMGATYLDMFYNDASRVKTLAGSTAAVNWWLRSASDANSFRVVTTSGAGGWAYAQELRAVSPGFCT